MKQKTLKNQSTINLILEKIKFVNQSIKSHFKKLAFMIMIVICDTKAYSQEIPDSTGSIMQIILMLLLIW